ncbi:NAD(P)-dependent alcohol dehydrogenase [Rhodotorula paludigena]|uniref:NAD(P)-dependent alcohol dehydrogenase n=1 Tax=Rhodotorula paludigena TaxID=86838 RepID=UPI00316C6269
MPTQTQALVVAQVGATPVLTDIELADPQPNEVLVRITACGVCHTDNLIQHGGIPSAFPSILGHEGSGTVVAIGSAVTRVQPGDSVLLSYSTCGECPYCQNDRPAACQNFFAQNFGRTRNAAVGSDPVAKAVATGEAIHGTFFGQSAFGRHALVVKSSVVKVSPGTDLIQLAPVGCGLQSGAGVLLNKFKPSPESSVAIFGLGAVGFGALWAAVHLKVKTIIVVDLFPSRRDLALSQGATHALAGDSPSLLADLRALTGGMGAQYAVEATGVERVLRTAWEAIANFGHVCSVGNPGPGVKGPFDINDMVNTSKTWSGLAEGDSNPPIFVPQLMRLYEQGEFPIQSISKVYPVERYDEAIADMKAGTVIKPIITFA